jgi:hypothetical protein
VGGPVLEHDVQVLVVLMENVGDCGLDDVDVALEIAGATGAGFGRFNPKSQATVLGLAE